MLRRTILSTSLLSPLSVFASVEAPVQGQDYTVLPTPVQTQNSKKIEVLTFFGYFCPHCYSYEKVISPWAEKLPDDVSYQLIPVAWNENFNHFSTAFYALEATKQIKPYHLKLFDAVIKQGKEFTNINQIADYLASEGMNKKDFLKAANSFTVKMKTDRAMKTWLAYGIDGTPANAVNGKFITAPHMVGTREGAIKVIEKLIEQERKNRK